MSVAYSNKMGQFPIESFVRLFLLNDQVSCRELCTSYNVETTDTGIKFLKRDASFTKVCRIKVLSLNLNLICGLKTFRSRLRNGSCWKMSSRKMSKIYFF